MSNLMTKTPVVMSINSHDPSGASGISADIETLTCLGCHCTPIITKLCARDTTNQKDCQTTDTSILIEQMRAILEDIEIDLIKIGDLAALNNAEAVHTILRDYPHIPVLLHASDCLSEQNDDTRRRALASLLIPQANLVVMNHHSSLQLATGSDNLSACAHAIKELGCDNLLITDGEVGGDHVANFWFGRDDYKRYEWSRLTHQYRGAGSTLTAALAAYLAHGLSHNESIHQAQYFTQQALEHGRRIGMGKLLPNRLYWCRDSDSTLTPTGN